MSWDCFLLIRLEKLWYNNDETNQKFQSKRIMFGREVVRIEVQYDVTTEWMNGGAFSAGYLVELLLVEHLVSVHMTTVCQACTYNSTCPCPWPVRGTSIEASFLETNVFRWHALTFSGDPQQDRSSEYWSYDIVTQCWSLLSPVDSYRIAYWHINEKVFGSPARQISSQWPSRKWTVL